MGSTPIASNKIPPISIFGVLLITKEIFMITKTKIICANCGKQIEKLAAEIKRQKKKGKTKFYCNLKCAGRDNCSHLEQYSKQTTEVIKKYCDNRQDEYSPYRYHFNIAKRRSLTYKRDFDITLEFLKELWLSQDGKCAVTGLPLGIKYIQTKKQKKDKTPFQASLDRIDNNKGYTRDNVRFVCYIFNIARNDFDDEQVIDFCKQVASNV